MLQGTRQAPKSKFRSQKRGTNKHDGPSHFSLSCLKVEFLVKKSLKLIISIKWFGKLVSK